jgi:hypothetical protein
MPVPTPAITVSRSRGSPGSIEVVYSAGVPTVVDSLRATIPALVALVTGSTGAALGRRPGADAWSAATVVSHLADAELVYGVRIRLALTQPGALLVAFDEKEWAGRFGPYDDDPHRALARFRVVRESTLAVLDSVTDEEWQRVGLHEEIGEITVAALADRMAAHDADHLNQIRSALGAS